MRLANDLRPGNYYMVSAVDGTNFLIPKENREITC